MSKIWLLNDHRLGNYNQSLGVAKYLSEDGCELIEKSICFNKFSKLPNFLLGKNGLAIDKKNSDNISNDFPDLIIATGRKLAHAALYIKKFSGGKSRIIQIMNPNLCFKHFALIILPQHDNCQSKAPNIIRTIGSPNNVNYAQIKTQAKWSKLSKPIIALVIGGSSKDTKVAPEEFIKLAQETSNISKKLGGTMIVTTSPRTGAENVKNIKENISAKCEFFAWGKDNTKNNPYPAMLKSADYIIVTGDSMSMCSEACATGKPTYIYASGFSGKKHQRLHKNLYDLGYAKSFENFIDNQEIWHYESLNEAKRIAEHIENYL